MKVIAIKDSPKVTYKSSVGVIIERAYSKGDIFDYVDQLSFRLVGHAEWINPIRHNHILIFHNVLQTEIDVPQEDFISLEEFRQNKLTELGI